MKRSLPMTGTLGLLEELSPYIPDEFINRQWPKGPTGGRRRVFSAAQLWRTHLLLLLTPAHSINLVARLLQEQRGWRRFAHLAHRERVPDVQMLHRFRAEVGVGGLRAINEELARPLVQRVSDRPDTIAIIDATDLPAACRGFKKRMVPATRLSTRLRDDAAQSQGKATGTSGIRNTRCGFGWRSIRTRSCWFHW
jgi:hypothetical protein